MTASFALKRLDDLMDEIGHLKRNIGEESETVELAGIWEDVSVDQETLREAEESVFKGVE